MNVKKFKGEVIVITGVRGVGKTLLANQIASDLRGSCWNRRPLILDMWPSGPSGIDARILQETRPKPDTLIITSDFKLTLRELKKLGVSPRWNCIKTISISLTGNPFKI